jgi:hypothetical protein
MNNWAAAGGVVRFEPDSGWSWQAWNGTLTLSPPDRGLIADGKNVALSDDVRALASGLIGRSYTSTGFADIPGTVAGAVIDVPHSATDPRTEIGGQGIILRSSAGTFTITCVPSFKAAAPPIPDPLLVKTGRWFVESAGQSQASSE